MFIHKLWLRKNERSVPPILGEQSRGVRRQRFLESLPIDKVGIRIVGEFQIHRAARSSSSFASLNSSRRFWTLCGPWRCSLRSSLLNRWR